MIWVYAIGERPEVPPPAGVTGLAGAPVEGVREGRLLAALSRHADAPEVSVRDALWTHEHVVERLMADRAVLPVRFGSELPDEAALRRTLAQRHDALLDTLDRVRGTVELAVRAVFSRGSRGPEVRATAVGAQAEGDETGREYVRAKLELRSRAEAAGAALHAPLAAFAVAGVRHPSRGPGELLHASYLVEALSVTEFRTLAQRLQRERPDVALLCTGPWPPYSFVEVPMRSGRTEGTGG